MSEAKFILSKEELLNQVKTLGDLGLKSSYSYKTNREVGNVLQDISDVDFSIHAREEIGMIKNKSKIWFFSQAESLEELKELLGERIRNFVVDNEIDFFRILEVVSKEKIKINLSLRMKFQEHRVGTGKYFVYGMPSKVVNELILENKDNEFVEKFGIHVHRKSQNTSEWRIKDELKDSLSLEVLKVIDFVNFGGGLPIKYRSYNLGDYSYIFDCLKESMEFLRDHNIETYIEPGRFFAGPCIKLETEIIQVQKKNLILNVSIYNCALDSILTGTKMLVNGELENPDKGKDYLLKGNSPTRDDIFRYKVKLKNPKVGDKIIFLNAGAYNYATDFFGYKKLETEIVE